MKRRRHRVGRVSVDFTVIEKFAAIAMTDTPLAVVADSWTLSRKSSLHRRKDGTYTLCLIWKSQDGHRLSSTYRGLSLEASAP